MTMGFNWGLPEQASAEALVIDQGISIIHWAMVIMFILWGGYFAYCLIAYRQRPGQRAIYPEPSHTTTMVPEILVIIFEVILLAAYALPKWTEMKFTPPKESESTVVRIVAEQFAWNVHYPGDDGKFGKTDPARINMNNPVGLDREDPAAADDIILANEMYVPLGRKVLMYLSSKDVIHDFFVPEFRVKQDIVPGLRIPLWFEPTKLGQYEFVCAQLCGIAHYAMRGDFYVMQPDAYAAWLKNQAES